MTGAPERIELSVAVMYHPSRVANLPRLVESCAPAVPQLVADPDPAGPPSPLRTAKAAWAAVPDTATHHLVLQDDVLLAEGFTAHLERAVRARPQDGIALYVNRNSPQNSYLVRRAAAAGSPWAPLSPHEYTPTLGLVLPAADARALAQYLRTHPDDLRDDDELVTGFCRDRGITVLATVPHLVEHANQPSIAGNAEHGIRCGVAFAGGGADPSPEQWAVPLPKDLLRRAAAGWDREFAVEFYDSRCLLRFVRAGRGEPVESSFGWEWTDWSAAVGVPPDAVLAALAEELSAPGSAARTAALSAVPARTAADLWAAAYLLGADAATVEGPPEARLPRADRDRLVRRAVESWIACGLNAEDAAAADERARRALTELALAAVARGAAAGGRGPGPDDEGEAQDA
ncbi:hypothetical protein [Kitasatospora cheerisanensis]|uniref:hypothetical protein n=1 Tax=Kitasatospora cheerisanensis TaxID=81942 RepID=UPI00068B3B39|nr:hypothetical protein [Kitasatospora cheerisanensis]